MNYILDNGTVKLTVSSTGAELISLIKNGKEFLWQGDPQYWKGHATNLFPIVGRVKEGKYYLKDKEYEMKCHGFTSVSEFEVEEQTETKLVMVLKSNDVTRSQYPFEFEYRVTHELCGCEWKTTYTVTNPSETETLLFSVGAHPGFNMPLAEGEKFEDDWIEFDVESAPSDIICENCFPTGERKSYPLIDGKILPLRHTLFDNDALMLGDMSCRRLTIKSNNTPTQIRVCFDDMAYLGIWHAPRTEAPYVCIEPWNGLPSPSVGKEDFEKKPTLMRLAPGKTYSAGISVEIKN